ncbi:MAG: EamA family transporter [Thermomicrobiales bacterium]|nr:EamA family transporter [Thermomicrobiales bacterium]
MTPLAFALVLSSAVLHAGWNLAAKRSGGGIAFIWLFNALASVIYAPVALAVALIARPRIGPIEIAFILGSAALHLTYFVFLQRGYRLGDLSLIYPLARGTGPCISTAAAILLLGERPSGLALAGAATIAVCVFALAGGGAGNVRNSGVAIRYGLITGAFIASYTLWDKVAVGTLLIPPLIYDWCNGFSRTVVLAPHALRHWTEVQGEWVANRREALIVAVCSPLAYILVLTALSFTPVSYVAPMREIGILFGTIAGARFLGEGNARRRVVAAAGMVVGVAALAIG